MDTTQSFYHRHRFPIEIISHCVWLYFRFSLSFRDVEEMMAKRGVVLTYETVREWCLKFGGIYAKRMRSRSSRFASLSSQTPGISQTSSRTSSQCGDIAVLQSGPNARSSYPHAERTH